MPAPPSSPSCPTTPESTPSAPFPPAGPTKPGTLTMTLHEAEGLSLPRGKKFVFSRRRGLASGSWWAMSPVFLPYAVVEFGGVRVRIAAVEGSGERPVWPGGTTKYNFEVEGREGEDGVEVGVFIRHPDPPPGEGGWTGQKGVEWVKVEGGTGRVRMGVWFVEEPPAAAELTVDEFELLAVLGAGTYGRVMQVRKKDTGRIYALKAVPKLVLVLCSKAQQAVDERLILAQINSLFTVPLEFAFQSPQKLYLGLVFINGGEHEHRKRQHRFTVDSARLYMAELVCALECLHGAGILHRDLKPDNALLDGDGHVLPCDFGLSESAMFDDGAFNFVTPEVLRGESYRRGVDWWALGVVLYKMLTGKLPFYAGSPKLTLQRISEGPVGSSMHLMQMPAPARDLVLRLLDRDAATRLGVRGAAEVRAHKFFEDIDWGKAVRKEYEMKFKPAVLNPSDLNNFHQRFTSQIPQDSVAEGRPLSSAEQDLFAGFSYARPDAELEGIERLDTGSIEDLAQFP
ncbi:serine/threonine protein kinase-like protein [Staphylotrichum tortipilum]|uniref:Serine/threonine protein kinase-like protein n=1 Tax=Staphylotrichum tortipilum TaxID=2831512 RepID=A0AAN6RW87_9PEZI|nr:serine/threonine protein kinase-like protein [Staphylotrichum longicolle]